MHEFISAKSLFIIPDVNKYFKQRRLISGSNVGAAATTQANTNPGLQART
jgi:hypothetical protein